MGMGNERRRSRVDMCRGFLLLGGGGLEAGVEWGTVGGVRGEEKLEADDGCEEGDRAGTASRRR
jgi:hypothetical protein